MTASAIIMNLASLTLGAQAKLTPEQKRELMWLILFVVAAGITLLVIVMLLMRSNKRQLLKLESRPAKKHAANPDIWKAGGDRLIARMSPFPKANPSDGHLDVEDEEDRQDPETDDASSDDDVNDEEENDNDENQTRS